MTPAVPACPELSLADPPWPAAKGLRTFLAPMEGVTHPAFRELISSRGGVGVVCTEFVRISSGPLNQSLLRQQVCHASGSALCVQVMGNHIEHLAQATQVVAAAGADIVDLNVGCPAPRAVRKGVGSALLKDLSLLGRVVSTMRRHTSGTLSAKIRAGFDDSGAALAVARVIEDSGADLLTVHPRRRVDFYEGVADWRIIEAIKRTVRIPVIGNGDIWYAADALRMRRETGCDGVMIGRGALRNPWIFVQLDQLCAGREPIAPGPGEVVQHFRELSQMLAAERPRGQVGMLKEQIRYLARAFPDGRAFLLQALRAQSVSELGEHLEGHLALQPELDLRAHGGTLERSGSGVLPPASVGTILQQL